MEWNGIYFDPWTSDFISTHTYHLSYSQETGGMFLESKGSSFIARPLVGL